jgi:hypothetical protein
LAKIKHHSDQQEVVRKAIAERRIAEKAEADSMAAAAKAASVEAEVKKLKEMAALRAEHKMHEEELRRTAKAKLDEIQNTAIDLTWDEEKKREVEEEKDAKKHVIEVDLVLFLLDQPTSCFYISCTSCFFLAV